MRVFRCLMALVVCALAGCAGERSVPDGYVDAMTRPPVGGPTPTEGLRTRAGNAADTGLVSAMAASSGQQYATVQRIRPPEMHRKVQIAATGFATQDLEAVLESRERELFEDRGQEFLFLIAGPDVRQAYFDEIVREVCANTKLSFENSGSFPLTIIPVEPPQGGGAPSGPYRYHLAHAVSVHALLRTTPRFRTLIQNTKTPGLMAGRSVGFLLIRSRSMRDRLIGVPANRADRDIRTDPKLMELVSDLDEDPDVLYFNFMSLAPHMIERAIPLVTKLLRIEVDDGDPKTLVDPLDNKYAERLAKGLQRHIDKGGRQVRFFESDDTLNDRNEPLDSDDGPCLQLRNGRG